MATIAPRVVRPRRSVLYVPGSNARALEKAKGLDADVLILDLEDPVAPELKAAARANIAAAVAAGGFGHQQLVIRINGLASEFGHDDIAMVAAAGAAAVLVPKIGSPDDIGVVRAALAAAGAPPALLLWAMMETPLAVINAGAIAAAAAAAYPLEVFVIGTNDLAKETRAALVPGRQPMLAWLSTIVVAARAYGLDVIDGVYNQFNDADGLQRELEQGRALGMDGKTLIHPGQIAATNAVFAPSADEIAEARTMVDLFTLPANRDKAVVAHNGRMVERLHAEMARRVLMLADAIAGRAQVTRPSGAG